MVVQRTTTVRVENNWRVAAQRFPRDASGGTGAGLFLSFRRRRTTNIPPCATNPASSGRQHEPAPGCKCSERPPKQHPPFSRMSVFTRPHQQPPLGGGRGGPNRDGEHGGAKLTLFCTITVVRPCFCLMCCDNGGEEHLRIDPSEWAAEERELCVITHEAFCRRRYELPSDLARKIHADQ